MPRRVKVHAQAQRDPMQGRPMQTNRPGSREIPEQHARRIVAREVLTPADLETRFALTGGQLHHGELALDQMLVMRPSPSAARYRTVIPGLFLGGSGSHPGGGVRPTAGVLAAEAVLVA